MRGMAASVLAAGLLVLAACDSDDTATDNDRRPATQASSQDSPGDGASGPRGDRNDTSGRPTGATTTTAVATTTTRPPVEGVHTPRCVTEVGDGESLSLIADSVDADDVTVESLQLENNLTDADTLRVGDYLDICVGNGLDDIGGGSKAPPAIPEPKPGTQVAATGVAAQQEKLNALFGPLGMPALTVDGISGVITEQQLCAARVALNMPVSRADMVPGSPEEQALLSTDRLPIPPASPVASDRWVLIDQRCQVLFAGEGRDRLAIAFPTSTGEPDNPTRNQTASRVSRYDPALDNAGWHNSEEYPIDNPINGNMYKPIYFDDGQAIHGALQIPPSPASKGCARLRLDHQDALIAWLGLQDVEWPLWKESDINLTVTVQGTFY